MLTFSYPYIFLLLLLPFLVNRFAPVFHQLQPVLRVPFFPRLSRVLQQTPESLATVRYGSLLQMLLIWFCWVAVVAALARPQWVEEPITRSLPKRDLMLAVDLSASMEAEDFNGENGKSISRLVAVKQVLDDFLVRREDDRVGIIVFGSAPYLQVPFTDDIAVCRQLLKEVQVHMAGPKTAFGDAIGLAIGYFDASDIKQKVMIVLTDGNDTASELPPEKAADIAAKHQIIIHTIGVGDPASVGEEKFDEAVLKSVANITGGQYFYAQDRSRLDDVYNQIDDLQSGMVDITRYRPVTDYYYVPLGFVMVIVFLWHGLKLGFGRKRRKGR